MSLLGSEVEKATPPTEATLDDRYDELDELPKAMAISIIKQNIILSDAI